MSEHEPRNLPEWAPKDAGKEFTSFVMKGVDGGHDGMPGQKTSGSKPQRRRRRPQLSAQDYIDGILEGNRTILGRAITLIESNNPAHQELAQEVLNPLLPQTGKSVRVGITGVPGAGKSSFIESLGTRLCDQGKKVAVLAVDPSSTLTGGSILGDKTRMEHLGRHPNAFIRPSPSGGTLGGVARKSRETMLLCEAFGFDTLLVETVGVGQSEVTVRSMVDFFLLVMIAGAGDELQGIKKGVIEIADALLVNKADGDNERPAKRAAREYSNALHYLTPVTEGWKPEAYTCSAHTGTGVLEAWEVVERFCEHTRQSGVFDRRRQQQAISWVHSMVEEYLKTVFYSDPEIQRFLPSVEDQVAQGAITASSAVKKLVQSFHRQS